MAYSVTLPSTQKVAYALQTATPGTGAALAAAADPPDRSAGSITILVMNLFY
jgi:hypothetical protein